MKTKTLVLLSVLIFIASFSSAFTFDSRNQQGGALLADPTNKIISTSISQKALMLCGGGPLPGGVKNDVWSFDGSSYINVLVNNVTPPLTQWPVEYGCKSVYFQNKIWIIGGQLANGQLSGVWNSPDGIKWNQVSNNSVTQRMQFGLTVYNNEMWIFGGFIDSNGTRKQTNDVYHSSNGINWTQLTTPPWSKRADFKVAVYNNKIWLIGGRSMAGYLNEVWTFDGTTWIQEPNAPWNGQAAYGLEVYKNKIWMIGGTTSGGLTNNVWSFDGTTWTQAPNAPWRSRFLHTSFVINNKLYITSGAPSPTTYLLNDMYSFDGTKWKEEPISPLLGRYYMDAVAVPITF